MGRRSISLTPFVWFVLANYLQIAVGFAVSIAASLALTPDERGLIAGLLQLGYLLSLAVVAGYDRVSSALEVPPSLSSLLRACKVRLLALNFLAVCLLVAPWRIYLDGRLAKPALVALLVALSVGQTLTRLFATVDLRSVNSTRRLVKKRWLYILSSLIGLIVLCIWMPNDGLSWVAIAYVAPLGLLVSLDGRTLREVAFSRHGSSPRSVNLRRAAIRLAPGPIAQFIVLRLDRFVLAVYASPATLGRYVMLASVTEFLALPYRLSFERAVSGRFSGTSKFASGSYSCVIARWTYILPVVVTCSAGFFVIPWALGSEYAMGEATVIFLAAGAGALAMAHINLGKIAESGSGGASSTPEMVGLLVMLALFALPVRLDLDSRAAASSFGGYMAIAIAAILIHMRRTRTVSCQ